MNRVNRKSNYGVTLVEALVAIVLVALIGISVISILVHTYRVQKFERERVVALNAATQKMEILKRSIFPTMKASSESVLLDVNNTPDIATDDIRGTLTVKARSLDGTEITQPPDADVIDLEVTVTWRSQSKNHFQTIRTIVAP